MENESDFTHILLLVAAVYLFIKVWPRIKAFVVVWRQRITAHRFVLVETPPERAVQVVLDAGTADLRALGFTRRFSFQIEGGGKSRRYDCHAKSDDPGTIALVTAPQHPAQRPYDIHLQTRFRRGAGAGKEFAVETIGGAVDLASCQQLPHAEYLGTVTTNQLWQEHQQRVGEYETAGHRRIFEDQGTAYVDQATQRNDALMRKRADDGIYVRNRDGSYRHTASAAFAVLKNAGTPPTSTTVLESVHPEQPEAIRLEAARCSLTRAAQEHEETPGYLILFAISLVASVIGLWIWGGWQTAVFLTLIIFIHELGHFLGMKVCGYRDARIFFVPMLGGVATGKKSNPTPVQELIVLLLGPVPGLFLGVIATVAYSLVEGAPEWLYEFGAYAFIINYLNLLPVMPLDGGRIVNALFMRRYPRLQFIFSIVSIIMLAGGAVLLGSLLLAMIALFGVLRLRTEWFTGTLEKAVLPRLSSETPDPDDTTLLVVQAMRNTAIPEPLKSLPTRIALVNQIVAALARTKASVAVMITGSIVYFLSLIVPVVLYLAVVALFTDALDFADSDGSRESVIELVEVETENQ